VFDNLNTYQATTHFNGQSTVELDGRPNQSGSATGRNSRQPAAA
jgi:hypothetical protein